MEEEMVEKWKKEDTFQTQNQLSEDRGDEVSASLIGEWIIWLEICVPLID